MIKIADMYSYRKIFMWLSAWAAAFGGLTLGTAYAAGTPATTEVASTAQAVYVLSDGSGIQTTSALASARVGRVCSVRIKPDGTTEEPAKEISIGKGKSGLFAFELINYGNIANDVVMSALIEPGPGQTLEQLTNMLQEVRLGWDADGDDRIETFLGGSRGTFRAVPSDKSVAFGARITLRDDAPLTAFNMRLSTRCKDDAQETDYDNVVRVHIVEGYTVGDRVWLDENLNGIQDPAEPGVGGIEVELRDEAGALRETAITRSSGHYLFHNVIPGRYQLVYRLPPHYRFTKVDEGDDETKDSDAQVASDNALSASSPFFEVIEGSENTIYDAGVFQVVDVEVVKTLLTPTLFLGKPVEYLITVENKGREMLTSMLVLDYLNANFEQATWRCEATSGSSCTQSGTGDIEDNVTLAAGGLLRYSLYATISSRAPVGAGITNTASVVLPPGVIDVDTLDKLDEDEDKQIESISVNAPIQTKGVANLHKRAEPDDTVPLHIGDAITYTIAFEVRDEMLTDVIITDTLSPYLTSPQLNSTPPASELRFDEATREIYARYNTLTPGTAVTLTIDSEVTRQAGHQSKLVNPGARVRWGAGTAESNVSTNVLRHTVLNEADLVIEQSTNLLVAVRGEVLQYRIAIYNSGPQDVYDAVVQFLLPSVLEDGRWQCMSSLGAVCTPQGTGDIRQKVSIPAGETVTYLVDAVVAQRAPFGTEINTIAQVTPAGGLYDPDLSNNLARLTRDVSSASIKEVSKRAEPIAGTPLQPGGNLRYTISFTSAGPDTLRNLTLRDSLDSLLDWQNTQVKVLVDGSESGQFRPSSVAYDYQRGEVSVVFLSLPPEVKVDLVIDTRVRYDAPALSSITNDGAEVVWLGVNAQSLPTVSHQVAGVCQFNITPDGTVDHPANYPSNISTLPGLTHYLPYTIRNNGNDLTQIMLDLQMVEASTLKGALSSIFADADSDRLPDGSPINLVTLEAGAYIQVLVGVTMPQGDESLTGDVFFNLLGACPNDGMRDENNISHLKLRSGGLAEDISKRLVTACPDDDVLLSSCRTVPADLLLYENSDVTYQITLVVKHRPLTNLVIRDLVDINLATDETLFQHNLAVVKGVTGRVYDVPYISAYTPYTAAERAQDPEHSGVVTWTFGEVPSNTRVTTGLRATIKPQTEWEHAVEGRLALGNDACVTFDGALSERCAQTPDQTVVPNVALALRKEVTPATFTSGTPLTYTITLTNGDKVPGEVGAAPPLNDLKLHDPLPRGMSYISGSTTLTLSSGQIATCERANCDPEILSLTAYSQALTDEVLANPRSDGYELLRTVVPEVVLKGSVDEVRRYLATRADGVLAWTIPPLLAGESVTLSFKVEVGPEALFGDDSVNHALATARNSHQQVIAVNSDAVSARPDLVLFEVSGLITGTAFIDRDLNHSHSAFDLPVQGLRLYLENGLSTITDEYGRYTFPDVDAGVHLLKADQTTVAGLALQRSAFESAPGLWRLRVHSGLITEQNIAFLPPTPRIERSQEISVARGPATLRKRNIPSADGLIIELYLQVTSTLPQVAIREMLPRATLSGAVTLPDIELIRGQSWLTRPITAHLEGQQLDIFLGDVPAGAELIFRYTLDILEDQPLSTPELLWALP